MIAGDSVSYELTFDFRPSETNVPQHSLELDLVGCVQGEILAAWVLAVLYLARVLSASALMRSGPSLAFEFEILRRDLRDRAAGSKHVLH